MGHFEKGVSTALCVLCLAAGVLLAVLGFGGSYGGGSAGLLLGALMFITVPAVMLFGLYGGSAAKKRAPTPWELLWEHRLCWCPSERRCV